MTETTTRPLRRSSTDKIVGGVAGGVARYLGVDPAIVRIGLALTMFLGGIGFVAYILAWILLPVDDADDGDGPATRLGTDGARILGAVLVFVAAASMLDDAWWAGELVLPVALIAIGAWLIFRPDKSTSVDDGSDGVDRDDGVDHTVVLEHTDELTSAPADVLPPPPSSAPARTPPPPPPPVDRDAGFPTSRATAGVMALVAGGLWLAAANGADISLEAALAICLAICGLGLVVGGFLGRGRLLIGLAVPLVLALLAASAIDVPVRGGIGDRSHTPLELSDLEDAYRLGVGEVILDLRGLDRDELRGTTTNIEASVAIGSLQVLVPTDVTVTGAAKAQLGDVDVLGRSQSGTSSEQRIRLDGDEGAGVLDLDLRVGIGEVRVR